MQIDPLQNTHNFLNKQAVTHFCLCRGLKIADLTAYLQGNVLGKNNKNLINSISILYNP
jgi:hypothetical protein